MSFRAGWWASIGWRSWLCVAGVALAALPLLQGGWLAAVVAGFVGLAVVGTWVWGTSSRRTVGLAVGVGLLASMVAVFAVSQWRPGKISPPPEDWLAGWLLIGLGCVAALAVDGYVHASDGRVRIGKTGPVLSVRQLDATVIALGTATLTLICCCGVFIQWEYDGDLRFTVRDSEVLPLPPTLRLVSADPRSSCGSSGACSAEFVVTASDGADRGTTVVRLVDHLRRVGWPLKQDQALYSACRETAGVLPWTSHHLWLYGDGEPMPRPPVAPDAVVVHISNLGC